MNSRCILTHLNFFSILTILVCILIYSQSAMYLIIYTIVIIASSIWLSCVAINTLLNQSQPIDYENDSNLWNSLKKFFNFQRVKFQEKKVLNELHKKETEFCKEHQISQILCKTLVKRWYHVISPEETFIKESEQLLETVLTRLLLVIPQINTDKLLIELLAVLLRHFKEFQRAKKKVSKNSNLKIDNLYRYARPNSRIDSHLEEYSYKITVQILREFISWELWNSFPCCILVAILSKKLTFSAIKIISEPKFILSIIRASLSTTPSSFIDKHDSSVIDNESFTESKVNVVEYATVSREHPSEVFYSAIDTKSKDFDVPDSIKMEKSDEFKTIDEDALILDTSDSLDWSHFSLNKSNESNTEPAIIAYQSPEVVAPIHWTNSDDFDLIAVGHDLTQSSEQSFLGKRLWNFVADTESENVLSTHKKPESSNPSFNISDEVNVFASHSIKELQQKSANAVQHTVTDAMHKIGDLQDEVAGHVGDILDFGIAGIKKGLRLTGLQDTVTPPIKSPKLSPKERTQPAVSEDVSQNRLSTAIIAEEESPEYEDTADFASTIAKLRSLLQQKSSESTTNTPAVSPLMTGDTCTITNSSPAGILMINSNTLNSLVISPSVQHGISANRPSGDNFISRTMTGVFNTLKTALPGNISDVPTTGIIHRFNQRWIFEENKENDFSKLLDTLLTERRDFCNVDAAYEATDNADSVMQQNELDTSAYDDDFDECFSNIPMSHLLTDICCELLQDTESNLIQDPVIQGLLLSAGRPLEKEISSFARQTMKKIDSIDDFIWNITVTTTESDNDKNEIIDLLKQNISVLIQKIIGNQDLHIAISFLIESFQEKSINIDLCLQLFEIMISNIIETNQKIGYK